MRCNNVINTSNLGILANFELLYRIITEAGRYIALETKVQVPPRPNVYVYDLILQPRKQCTGNQQYRIVVITLFTETLQICFVKHIAPSNKHCFVVPGFCIKYYGNRFGELTFNKVKTRGTSDACLRGQTP